MSTATRRPGDESGVSFIELIIYVLLSSLLLAGMAVILGNSWTTQKNVMSVTEATNRGQAMTATIERALRNSIEFTISSTGDTLLVRTTLPGDLRCQGFALQGGKGKTGGSAQLALSATTLSTKTTAWAPWQTGIAQQGTTRFFTKSGSRVTYAFDVATSGASVRFSGQAYGRIPKTIEIGAQPCWK